MRNVSKAVGGWKLKDNARKLRERLQALSPLLSWEVIAPDPYKANLPDMYHYRVKANLALLDESTLVWEYTISLEVFERVELPVLARTTRLEAASKIGKLLLGL